MHKGEKKENIKQQSITPQFKLQKIQKRIRAWETKKKRSENALKKLHRREKIYQRKIKKEALNEINKDLEKELGL